MLRPRVYLAGGFNTNWQEKIIERLKDRFVFLNPRSHGLHAPHLYAPWDIHFVRNCDILFGYMESSNPSGYGLAFEIGLSYGLGKTTILVDERSQADAEFGRYYNLVRLSCSAVFSNLEDGINFLELFSHAVEPRRD